VDVEHPLVASGALDVTFDALFQAQVRSKELLLSLCWICNISHAGMRPGRQLLLSAS
jgi:hypothetical protein